MLTIKRIMKNKRKEKRSCRLILACCALLLFISVNAFAQQQVTVTGNVKDEKGEPIIGANVIVKGTGTGSVTNVEGDFSLANVQNGATLEISFIGYLNQDVKVNGTKPVSIILKEDTKMLDEVVVVGYGVQRKSDMTGAVASVNTKTLENRPQTNIIQSLQGAVPGLNISVTGTNAEGSSTKTRIRGENSITSCIRNSVAVIDPIHGSGLLSVGGVVLASFNASVLYFQNSAPFMRLGKLMGLSMVM